MLFDDIFAAIVDIDALGRWMSAMDAVRRQRLYKVRVNNAESQRKNVSLH